jgi:hypothetical protein
MNNFKKIIEECWNVPTNEYANIFQKNGKCYSMNRDSYYSQIIEDKDFSVDVGNTKVLANFSSNGDLKKLSFYRNPYLTEDKPGTWVSNGFVSEEHLNIMINNSELNSVLCRKAKKISYDLVFNSLPRFIYEINDEKILQVFVPLYSEKEDPISSLVSIVSIHNNNGTDVFFPNVYQKKYSDTKNVEVKYKFNNQKMDGVDSWYLLTDPNETQQWDDKKIEQEIIFSVRYYKRKFNSLKISKLPKFGYLINRSLMNTNNTLSSNSEGNIVGANWGSAPVINRTWLRDMFYTSIPQMYVQPKIFEKVIIWFDKYQIKVRGDKFNGGIQHSVVNSLISTLLLGLYYDYWGDKKFIDSHLTIWRNCLSINEYLLQVLNHSKDGLISSKWISDGIAVGQYHTGTQIVLWKSFKIISEIAKYEFEDEKTFKKFKHAAKLLKMNILKNCTFQNSNGDKLFLEGCNILSHSTFYPVDAYKKDVVNQGLDFLTRVIKDNFINLKFHDGEESDTTLAPFYEFLREDNSIYKQSMKYAGSLNNPTYSKLSKGLSWGNQSEATFPGYITILMGCKTKCEFKKKIDELFKITDLDGSWWWWPYKVGKSNLEISRFNGCGKCGWASGVFGALSIKNILGIDYSYTHKKLEINLSNISPSYDWNQLKMPFGVMSIKVQRKNDGDYIQITIDDLDSNKLSNFIFSNQYQKKHTKIDVNSKIELEAVLSNESL